MYIRQLTYSALLLAPIVTSFDAWGMKPKKTQQKIAPKRCDLKISTKSCRQEYASLQYDLYLQKLLNRIAYDKWQTQPDAPHSQQILQALDQEHTCLETKQRLLIQEVNEASSLREQYIAITTLRSMFEADQKRTEEKIQKMETLSPLTAFQKTPRISDKRKHHENFGVQQRKIQKKFGEFGKISVKDLLN